MIPADTYVLQYGDVCKMTCSGPVPIDAAAELLALDAHFAFAMKRGQAFSAQKLRRLSNQLYDLMQRHQREVGADVIAFPPRLPTERVWGSGPHAA